MAQFTTTVLMTVKGEADSEEALKAKWKNIKNYGVFKFDFTFLPAGDIDPVFYPLQEGSDG